MNWTTILADVPTDLEAVLTTVVPIAMGVFVLLAGVSLVIRIFGKVGVRK